MSDTLCPSAPQTPQQLGDWLKNHLSLTVPAQPVCPHHSSPLDYLWYSFCENDPAAPPRTNGDCVVWACRGGGKTILAAAATLLDSLYKPQCRTRILAGSRDQSRCMYEYLTRFIDSGTLGIEGKFFKDSCRFANGSDVSIMAQSHTSVRGRHIQILRCDEVELFKPDVLTAAAFIAKKANDIRPAMQIFSTLHRPYGLMQSVLDDAAKNQTPIFQWCLWEIIERCTTDRSCSRCPLDYYCRQKARSASGFLAIDDAITLLGRTSKAAFESEMLCLRPSLDDAVFPEFDVELHVGKLDYDPSLPLYRSIDFGYRGPFVCLWIQIDAAGVIRVINEFVKTQNTLAENILQLNQMTPCSPHQVAATYCDPSGAACNGITGISSVDVLKKHGIKPIYHQSSILDGVELIRCAIRAADKTRRLLIADRCRYLIKAMQCYHFPDRSSTANLEMPKKDGVHDHPIDALRYFFIHHANRFSPGKRGY